MWNIESTIKPRAAALKISLANLAILVGPGCSKAALSEASNGGNLNREVAVRVDAKLKELEAFTQSVAPVRPDLSDARLVEQWLEDFRSKRAKAAASAPDPWSLLAELAPGNFDEVCAKHGLQRSELVATLTAAREQLHAVTESLVASNSDRAKPLL